MLGQAAEQARGAALLALAQKQLPVSALLRPGNAESAAVHIMGLCQRPDMLLQALNPSDGTLPGSGSISRGVIGMPKVLLST